MRSLLMIALTAGACAADNPAGSHAVVSPGDRVRRAIESNEPAATLSGVVRDPSTGGRLPARARIIDSLRAEVDAVLPSFGFWTDGEFRARVLPGPASVTISAGRRRSVDERVFMLAPGRRQSFRVDLHQPRVLRFEDRGWIGADLYRPVAGGSVLRRKPTINLLALGARAEGVRFVAAARPWTEEGYRSGREDEAAIARLASGLSGRGLTVALAGPRVKSPPYGEALFLGGEPSEISPPGRLATEPLFSAIMNARSQGALSIIRGLADVREIDPRADAAAYMPELEEMYRGSRFALDGGAWELPFLAACGMLPDAIAMSGSDAEFAVWFALLDMGYRIPAVHIPRGSLGAGTPPGESTFLMIGETALPEGHAPTLAEVTAAVRAGRVMGTNGPFAFLRVDGFGPGAVFEADGKRREIAIEAFSSTLRDDAIHSVEVVRNGVVTETIQGELRTMIAATGPVSETESAWYVLRVRSGPKGERVAWTGPVYFEGPLQGRPKPVATDVTGRVSGKDSGAPVAATVTATLGGEVVARAESDPETGEYALRCPPMAVVEVRAEGLAPDSVRVFEFTGARDEIVALHTDRRGLGARALAEPATYERMRLASGRARIDFDLLRATPLDPPTVPATFLQVVPTGEGALDVTQGRPPAGH